MKNCFLSSVVMLSVLCSGQVLALEALDDIGLADTSGQAGLEGVLRFNLTGADQDVRYTDGDGITGTAGALFIDNLTLAQVPVGGESRIKVDFTMDAGYNTSTSKAALVLTAKANSTAGSSDIVLNFNQISLDDDKVVVDVGDIVPVAILGWKDSATGGVRIRVGVNGGLDLTLRLGNELNDAARYLGALYGTMGSVSMSGLKLMDGDGSGEMVIDTIAVSGNVGATEKGINLGTASDPTKFALSSAGHANCGAVGVCVTLSGQTTVDASLTNIRLGSSTAPAVANLVVTGLNLGGTSITVGAH